MLRVHIVQVCYNLSDTGMEDLLYEAESVRRFVGLRLSEPIPDESTILHFRHLLEEHQLGQVHPRSYASRNYSTARTNPGHFAQP